MLAVISIRLESFRDFIDQYGPRISEEGIFLVTDSPPARGETVEFEVGLADDFRLLHGSGEVVWTVAAGQDQGQPAGAAVRFVETDESSRRLITRIVHQQRERGEPVFDLGGPPAAEHVAGGPAEEPFGPLPEPDVGLFDGLQFDLVEQGGFGPPPGAGGEPSAGPEAEAGPLLLEPELPDAAPEIELPGGDLEPPAPALVDREPAAAPPLEPEELPAAPPVEERATEELPEWMRPLEEPSGPAELLEMPDLSAIGDRAPVGPPPAETGPDREAPPLPSLEKELLSVEPEAAPPPVRPVEMPRPAARPEAEAPRRRSRWGWIAAAAGVMAIAALGAGAYREGDALKAWLGLTPPDGGAVPAPAGVREGPAPAPGEVEPDAAAEAPVAAPAAPAEPVAAAPAPEGTADEVRPAPPTGGAFRNVEAVTWQQEPGRTVVIVATDGAVSPDRVRVESVNGGNPRVLIKLLGVEQPLAQSTVPVGTRQVRQVRAGFHDLPGGPELHLVADLTGPSVRQEGVDLRGSEIRISLSGG